MEIKAAVLRRFNKIRGSPRSHEHDAGMIADMRKELDQALAGFQVSILWLVII